MFWFGRAVSGQRSFWMLVISPWEMSFLVFGLRHCFSQSSVSLLIQFNLDKQEQEIVRYLEVNAAEKQGRVYRA